ncbi:MAG: amidohydrolase [Candidatus Eisenbacteria bacterium]|uniref:Amidohydrolase n=1 Tax=Eiseniibacteriota bacterium TaxID=2212470 RepID=A0A538UA01_UNCEI|nr:MAG: amidohydrolase [Candidatus Eisenbacteria bacterium]
MTLATRPTFAAPPTRTSVDLVVTAGTVLTVDPEFRILPESAVAIQGGAIVAIGSPVEIARRYAARRRIDRPHSVLMPGLVNTHTHAAMSLLRGIADDRPLMEWLQKYIFPAEAKNVSPAFVRDGTNLAMAEMIRSGTTTFADMYYFEDDVARAVDAAGMRGVLGETWIDFPAPDNKTHEQALAYTRKFLAAWKGNRRVVAAIAPHAPYTCSAATYRSARQLADEFGAPLMTHLSGTVVAHGVWLSDDDMRLLAREKVALSHNPESNMKLGSGIAPIAKAVAAGIVVGLGTDGPAGSNNDFDMFESMDFAGKLAKVANLDPTALPARELVRMATLDGARALGLGDRIGSIEVGKEADLIAVDLTQERVRPVYDVTSIVVYAAKASDVSLTMVAGRVLFDGRSLKTIDEAQVAKAAEEWRKKITRSLGMPQATSARPDSPRGRSPTSRPRRC